MFSPSHWLRSLVSWLLQSVHSEPGAKIQRRLPQEIGRAVIERAQGYYDSRALWQQAVQERPARQTLWNRHSCRTLRTSRVTWIRSTRNWRLLNARGRPRERSYDLNMGNALVWQSWVVPAVPALYGRSVGFFGCNAPIPTEQSGCLGATCRCLVLTSRALPFGVAANSSVPAKLCEL